MLLYKWSALKKGLEDTSRKVDTQDWGFIKKEAGFLTRFSKKLSVDLFLELVTDTELL